MTHKFDGSLLNGSSEKEGDWCACSPLNSGGRPNTYAKKIYKAGSYVQASLLESSGRFVP